MSVTDGETEAEQSGGDSDECAFPWVLETTGDMKGSPKERNPAVPPLLLPSAL